jgi:glycerophosphoryl diester phosphodiesterase
MKQIRSNHNKFYFNHKLAIKVKYLIFLHIKAVNGMVEPDEIIIAHRGESHDAPENTLAAINLAWKRNIKSVEIDIHLTKDNEIVVIHDYDTLRISGIKKLVRESSLDELKCLDAGSFKGTEWTGETIPTLNEVLETIPENGKLIIEIKSDSKILDRLSNELSHSGLIESQIEIIAFNFETLAEAKRSMPHYRMLWLLDLDYSLPWWLWWRSKQEIIDKIRKFNLDGIDVWSGQLLTMKFIERFRKERFFVYAWTVDNPEKARELVESGINGITTNRAGWMRDQLK